MYEKVIDVTRQEVIRLLNQQRQDVFEELLQIPNLLKSQQDGQQRSLNSEDIEQWLEILKVEAYKVERLEVAFAVVGTMKAGKSTTINAIVGSEVLPNRNQPMTTLPTVIRHCPGKREPELTFPQPEPFNNLIARLKVKLEEKLEYGQIEQLTFCATPEGKILVGKILDGTLSEIKCSYKGNEEIFEFLKSINDIWRLASSNDINISVDDYLAAYNDIQAFPAIEVEFFHLRGLSERELQGKLSLIDTPGPNEAGQTCLKHIMKEQLEKSSAVLAVLDYTQLNAEADAEIRKSLDEIAGITDDRLFILVNKFDQKDRHGLDAEMLRSYIVKQLFEGRINRERVYPVSSKYGYLANRALSEIAQHGQLSDYRFNPWVEDFGLLALGACWESELDDVDEIKSRALKLWRGSQFDKPLSEIIQKGCENAATLSLKSAVAKMTEYDKKIVDSLSFRQQALNSDIQVVENQIKSLEEDICLIKNAEADARTIIDQSIKTLQRKIYKLFDDNEEELKQEIQKVFSSRKPDNWLTQRLDGFIGVAPEGRAQLDPKGHNDFATDEAAQHFLSSLIEMVAAHVEPLFKEMQLMIQSTVDEMASTIWESVNSRLQTVLLAAEKRLNETFSIMLDFPKPKVDAVVIDFAGLRESSVEEDTIFKTSTRYERKWYTLWCRKHEISYQFKEQIYRIHTKHVAEQSQKLLEDESNAIWTALDKYVRNEFSKSINQYFSDITDYLERFRGDLIDAKQDQELEGERMEKLQASMSKIINTAMVHQMSVQSFAKGFPAEESRLEMVG